MHILFGFLSSETGGTSSNDLGEWELVTNSDTRVLGFRDPRQPRPGQPDRQIS